MALLLALLVQFLPGLPDPDAPVTVGGVIEGPYIFREDEGQTTKVVLANGMTVIVRESHASTLTSLTLEARVGYLDEPPGSGLSRIVAESLSGGVMGADDSSGLHPLRRMGGASEVDVSERRTVYQVMVSPERTADALEWQAGVLTDPVFGDVGIEQAIDLLAAEQVRAMDRPRDLVLDRLIAVAYGDHPRGRSRRFEPDVARALDPSALEAFFDAHYVPSNLALVVVGPFLRGDILGEVVGTFGPLSRREPPPTSLEDDPGLAPGEPLNEDGPAPDSPRQDTSALPDGEAVSSPAVEGPEDSDAGQETPVSPGFRYDWQRGSLRRAHFAIAFRVPEASVAGTSERYVFETVMALLADGRASRLNAFVRDEQGVIDRAEGSYVESGTRRAPELLAVLTIAAADIDRAEVAVFTELERIRLFGVNAEEVARARVRVAQRHYERRQTAGGLGWDLARREFQGDWKLGERFPSGIAEVTASEVQAFVRDHFRQDNLAVFELLPADSARALGSEEFLSGILGGVPRQMVSRSIDPLDVTAQVPIMGDELVMDVSHPMNRFGIRRGPDVFIIEDHRVPLVSFGIFFPGGRVLESSENAGITELMLHSALEGTRRFNAAEIARRIENAGARIEPVNEADYFGYILDGVSGDLAAALDVLMEVWQEPSFLEGALEAARRLQRARMLENAEEAPLRAVQRLGAAVFAGDPYSLSRLGTPESLEAIDTAALEAWHFEHARSVMPVIVVAGDVNGSGIVSTIANTITNEDLFERDAALLPAPEPADPQPVFTFEEGLPYGVMAYGGSTGAFSSPDGISLRVIRDLLTGHGGRLARAFAAAGVPATSGVGELLMARAGMFHAVVSFVEEGVDGAAIREILDGEFERLALDGLDSEELDSAKARADVVHRIEVDRRRGRVNAVARAVLTGAGPDSVGVFSDVVRRLDSDTLRGAAERFVSSGNIHVIEIR